MSKWMSDTAIEGGLDFTATCTLMSLVSDVATPTDLTNSLASVALDSGDFTEADGTPSGREVAIAAKTGVSVTATGTVKHLVLSISGVVHIVTTVTDQVLTSGNTVDFPEWKHTIGDPE